MKEIKKQYNLGDTAKKYLAGSLNYVDHDQGRLFLREQISKIPSSSRILDVGCGTGVDLCSYSKMGFTKLYGIDPSEKSLDLAKDGLSGLADLKKGTFEKIPYDDAFFDVVISRHALHYSKKINPSLKEVFRVLKEHGKFIAIVSHPLADMHEKRDKNNNVLVSLFNKSVHITFPLHKFGDYFSLKFFKLFDLKGVYEFVGKERDEVVKDTYNTLCFVATKRAPN